VTLETEPILPVGRSGHWRAALGRPGFPAYVVAAGATAVGWNLGAVIFAWVALIVTTDPLAVGLVFAVRFLMLLVLGIPAGVLADRVDRRRMFQASALGGGAVAIGLAALAQASGNTLPLWALVAGSMALGALDAVRIAASQAYAFDLVGPILATTGIALANLAALSGSVVGSVAGGYVLDHGGVAPAFLMLAFVQACVVGALVLARPPGPRAPRPKAAKGAGLRESLTLLQRDRLLRLLAFVVIVVEVLGFSCATLIPVFTRDVFDAGPDAYGTMNAIRALGGVVALVLVIRLGTRAGTGLALLGGSMLFGLALVAFAVSPSFAAAVVPMLMVGAAGAATDSLSQALIQRSVTDAERGAAMGVWAFGLGFGPLGYVAAGAMAGRIGPVPTQALFGLALAGMSLALMGRPRLRALR
jgi:MFS family permease